MNMLPTCPLLLLFALSYSGPTMAAPADDAQLAELNMLRERYPHDVDHALARAQLLARLGDQDAALEDLRLAAVLAPDYEDVWRVRYTILLRMDDDAAQLELLQVREQAAQRFPEASWWHEIDRAEELRWALVGGGDYERLDNGQPSWNRLFANASYASQWGRYRFGVARDHRFGETDVTLALGGDVLFETDWWAGIDLAFADEPSFQPERGLGGHVGRKLADGWTVDLRYLRREYASSSVSSTTAMVEKYFGDFRIAYALGSSHLQGADHSLNHSLTGNWYYNDWASIGISVHGGEESEAVSAGSVQQTDVRGLSVTGRRNLNQRLELNWWLGTHKQGDYYRRSFLGMAITVRL